MSLLREKFSSRWAAAGVILAVGLIAGRASTTGFTSHAQAASGSMSAIDRLVAEDEIRQQLALYGLLADGDGLERRNPGDIADKIMTADVVNEIYPVTGPITHEVGRDWVAGRNRPKPPAPPAAAPGTAAAAVAQTNALLTAPTTAGRHFLVSTYFDEITPTEARTRTTALHFDMTKNMIGPDCRKTGEDTCGGRVVKGSMWVYHTIWKKTPEGWQMTVNRLRNDN